MSKNVFENYLNQTLKDPFGLCQVLASCNKKPRLGGVQIF